MGVSGDTRYCGRCGTRLAADNRGRVCGPCQRVKYGGAGRPAAGAAGVLAGRPDA